MARLAEDCASAECWWRRVRSVATGTAPSTATGGVGDAVSQPSRGRPGIKKFPADTCCRKKCAVERQDRSDRRVPVCEHEQKVGFEIDDSDQRVLPSTSARGSGAAAARRGSARARRTERKKVASWLGKPHQAVVVTEHELAVATKASPLSSSTLINRASSRKAHTGRCSFQEARFRWHCGPACARLIAGRLPSARLRPRPSASPRAP